MIPAFVQMPVLSVQPLTMPAPSVAPAQSIDFGALLLAQPALQAADMNANASPAKLPEVVPEHYAPIAEQPMLPLEAAVPIAPPPPPLVAAAQVQAKQPAEERIKIAVAVEAKPLLAVDMPAPTERAAPVVPAPFAELAAVIAKPAPADPVAQVSERVLDVARGNVWLDQLAGDIIAAQDDSRDLSFRLIPPQLGQLDVRIERLEAGLQLDFAAQTDEAAQIVAAAQPRLIEELRGQGVRVAGSEVATSSGQNSNGGQPHRQPQQPETPHRNFKQPTRTAKSGRFA